MQIYEPKCFRKGQNIGEVPKIGATEFIMARSTVTAAMHRRDYGGAFFSESMKHDYQQWSLIGNDIAAAIENHHGQFAVVCVGGAIKIRGHGKTAARVLQLFASETVIRDNCLIFDFR